jgi:hypothetical protein
MASLKSSLEDLDEAKKHINIRMDLVTRADNLPNGFCVLSAFEKKVYEAHNSFDSEQEKLWSDTVKQVKEKKEKQSFLPETRRCKWLKTEW